MIKPSFVSSALILATVFVPATYAAEPLDSPLNDRLRLDAGLFLATAETDLRLDADNGTAGTNFSAEDDLGLRQRSSLANVEFTLRIRERHSVRFEYSTLERGASRNIDRQIRFGNDVYQVNDLVNSRLDIHDFATTYSYSLLRRERFEFGYSFGLHLFEFETLAEVPARSIEEEESENGPLPTFGLHGTVRFTDRFHMEARGEYLDVDIGDVDGRYLSLKAALLYRFTRNLALGLGYAMTEIEAISNDVDDGARFTFTNAGGQLFLRVGF